MNKNIDTNTYSYIGGMAYYQDKEKTRQTVKQLITHIPAEPELEQKLERVLTEKAVPYEILIEPLKQLDSKGVHALTDALLPQKYSATDFASGAYFLEIGKVLVANSAKVAGEQEREVKHLFFGRNDTLPMYAMINTLYKDKYPMTCKALDTVFQEGKDSVEDTNKNLNKAGTLHHHMSEVACLVTRNLRGRFPDHVTDILMRHTLKDVLPLSRREDRLYKKVETIDEKYRAGLLAGKKVTDGDDRWNVLKQPYEEALTPTKWLGISF